MTVHYEPYTGEISTCIDSAIQIAAIARDEVVLTFNDTKVTVQPNHRDQVYAAWRAQRDLESRIRDADR